MALMSLGLFVFHLRSAPLTTTERSSNYRWAQSDPVGSGPRLQHVGDGEDTLTLSGELRPSVTGGPSNLSVLRLMAERGEAHLLMRGNGEVLGRWVIESINSSESELMNNGQAQSITFSLNLKKAQKASDTLGDFARVIRQVVDTTVTGGLF